MDNVKKYTHSNFFTNRDNNTLIKEFEGILHHNPHICNLDAVVGFLRASGYFSLRPFLDNIKVGSINSIFYFLHKAAEPFNCLEQDNLA